LSRDRKNKNNKNMFFYIYIFLKNIKIYSKTIYKKLFYISISIFFNFLCKFSLKSEHGMLEENGDQIHVTHETTDPFSKHDATSLPPIILEDQLKSNFN
jgi:hypothetical protein